MPIISILSYCVRIPKPVEKAISITKKPNPNRTGLFHIGNKEE